MNTVEMFLCGKMQIEDFKALYKKDKLLKTEIDSIVQDDAKESPEHPLWQRVSYDSLKRAGFSLTNRLEMQGALNGSLGDDLNFYSLISNYYKYYHPNVVTTDLYDKRYEFYLDAVSEYYDGPEVRSLLDSVIRDNLSIIPKTKRIRETKAQLKELFHMDDGKRPYWIQGPEWPMGAKSPMKYIKQIRKGEEVNYYFEDVDTKETRIITQYY